MSTARAIARSQRQSIAKNAHAVHAANLDMAKEIGRLRVAVGNLRALVARQCADHNLTLSPRDEAILRRATEKPPNGGSEDGEPGSDRESDEPEQEHDYGDPVG